MSHWNYRVIRHEDGPESWLTVHEVYYNAAGEPDGWVIAAADPHGETMDELRRDHAMIAEAFDKPVLRIEGDKLVEDGARA